MFEFLEFFCFCFKEFIIFIFDDPAVESHFPVHSSPVVQGVSLPLPYASQDT